mgnify:CR=1 FL=1
MLVAVSHALITGCMLGRDLERHLACSPRALAGGAVVAFSHLRASQADAGAAESLVDADDASQPPTPMRHVGAVQSEPS